MSRAHSLVLMILVCGLADTSPFQEQLAPTLVVSGATTEPARQKKALLIGVDDYRSVKPLTGSINDVESMRGLLVGKFDFPPANILVLKNSDATRSGILHAIRSHLIENTHSRDIIVLHYSGHGSRVWDTSQDEIDHWDETLVPYDGREPGVFDITDDEIDALLRELTAKTPNVTFIFDSCHSGTVARGGAQYRRIPDDQRIPLRKSMVPTPRAAEGPSGLRPAGAAYTLISGCRADELSNESAFEGHQQGALTYFFVQSVTRAAAGATYRDVMAEVSSAVSETFPSQHPQMEGARLDAFVFGDRDSLAQAFVLATPLGDSRIGLDGGQVYGISVGAKLDIFPPTTKVFDRSKDLLGSVEVDSVSPFHAEGRIVSGGPVPPHSRAALASLGYPDTKLRVFLAGDSSASLLEDIRERLQREETSTLVTSESNADILIRQDKDRIGFEMGDRERVFPEIAMTVADPGAEVLSAVRHWARWFRVLHLANPSPTVRVAMTFDEVAYNGTIREMADGASAEITIENMSDRDLYLSILDLNTTGQVDVLYPPPGAEEKLPARAQVRHKIEFFLPEGTDVVLDIIKAIATTSPINSAVFRQGSISGAKARRRITGDPLADFFERSVLALSRNARPVMLDSWTTAQQSVRVRNTPQRSRSFVIHFEPHKAPRDLRMLPGLIDCAHSDPSAGRPCWRVAPFAEDPDALEVTVGETRDTNEKGWSFAAAWDQAYELRASVNAARVEPVIEWEDNEAAYEPDPGVRDVLFDVPDKERARIDNHWSLTQVRAQEAWAIVQKTGREDGEEGASVTIGHPDTGYRRHPEIWASEESRSPVLFRHGYDYVDQDDDPLDSLETSGGLTNPGHGTKSSSVIVSPKGKQWIGGQPHEYVDGIAPGARAIPLRVHKSVVHFAPSRLAAAIWDASSSDGARVKRRPEILSISMGGLPSWSLWKAVRQAERQGIIVVAAAGNKVGFVVWPARFRETIGVAATNVECEPWNGSSRGPAVDIAAPGESVWMAHAGIDGTFSVRMGQGTTYSTAITAGVAALWLDRYREDNSLKELRRSGGLTDAFRRVIQSTAWRPGAIRNEAPMGVQCREGIRWDVANFGPGILDAARVLEAPLPSVAKSGLRDSMDFDSLPLFATLFPDSVEVSLVRERYAGLVGVSSGARFAEAGELEAEIMALYATNEDIRFVVDALTGSNVPSEADYMAARELLAAKQISRRLRGRLIAAGH